MRYLPPGSMRRQRWLGRLEGSIAALILVGLLGIGFIAAAPAELYRPAPATYHPHAFSMCRCHPVVLERIAANWTTVQTLCYPALGQCLLRTHRTIQTKCLSQEHSLSLVWVLP